MGERVKWSDLPTELLTMIGRSLDTRIDVLRFRSICSSWRSSIPPFSANPPRFPLQFPDPNTATLTEPPRWPPRLAFLFQTTLYYIQTLNPSTSSSTLSNKGWLMKVDESNSGKLRFVNPVLDSRTRYTITRPKTLNLLNFRVVEFGKAYTLQFQLPRKRRYVPFPCVKKLVVFPNSAWTNVDECSILMIFVDGKLGFAKRGDKKWTLVGESSSYDDIIVYKGQFYAVDRVGIVWWIECSSLKLVQFSPLCGLGSQKHLVVSCGALYVVDKYNDIDDDRKVVGFKVYKLDEELGQWVLVKSLGDQVFVLGADCSFSVSARGCSGYTGDCILFIDHRDETLVFNLKDHSILKHHSIHDHFGLFWPPDHTGLPQADGWVFDCEYTW
ncbi:putative F-box protein At1g65770 [Corylus avellana]|uniref:putative F-box protein At1g65770 n=1 Tax=Corylus avellana TaxID=13451 RepID=UPI001E1FE323|nr:putative F-box protein At1g65770 [Corylus avellana]